MTPAIPISVGVIGVAGWVFWPWIERLWDWPTPVEREAAGADEQFAGELQAMREAPVDPNLVSEVEADLNWAQAWHQFERSMLDEVDRVFAPILVAAAEFASFDDLREQTCPKELMPA